MSGPKIPAELIERAERILGDKKTARTWLDRPNLNLAGRRPLDKIESGGDAIVAGVLDRLGPPEDDPGS
jgi:uncharacterized protein (DUF2384 family)